MLKSMRDSVSSPFIKVLLTLLILSFVSFYGVSKIRGGCNPEVAAFVNGEPIGIGEYLMNIKNSFDFYRKLGLFKRGEVNESEMLERLKSLVLENMVDSKLKIQEAKKLGIKVSDSELADQISKQFTDPKTGEFNEKYYTYYLRQTGQSSEQFEETQREQLLGQKLEEFLKSTAKVSPDELLEDYKLRNETVDITYVKFTPQSFIAGLKSQSEKELIDFYKNNPDLFRNPEERQIEYAYLDPDDFIKPGDAELKSFFTEKFEGNGTEDYKGTRVRASHILFKTDKDQPDSKSLAEANGVYDLLKKGTDFAKYAQVHNEDATRFSGGDLGYFGNGKMVPEFEKAAFSLKKGEISKPIKTAFGYHIIRVTDLIPEGEVTFERLKNEVLYDYIRSQKDDEEKFKVVKEQMAKELNAVRARALKEPGKPLSELIAGSAIKYGKTEFIPAGGRIEDQMDAPQLVQTAFTLVKDQTSEILTSPITKRLFLVRVLGVEPPQVPPFDTIKTKVALEYSKRGAEEKSRKAAESFLETASKDPGKFESIARLLGYTTVETKPFKRNQTGTIPVLGIAPEIMKKAFALSEKSPLIKEVLNVGTNSYVVKLKAKSGADMKKFDEEKSSLLKVALEERQNQLVANWMQDVRSKAKIKRYEIKERF